MKKLNFLLVATFFLVSLSSLFGQVGPFAPAAGQPGSTAIHKDSSAIVSWATGIELHRGFQDIANPSVLAAYGVPSLALHKAEGGSIDVVSLGDAGVAILSFDRPIVNGDGPDFAVYENGFVDNFLELAFVEVSSDGKRFVRFPAISLTPTDEQVSEYDGLEPTNLYNFAGKYKESYGTPFDLDDIADSTDIDLYNIRFVKIVDVIGTINDEYANYDSEGNKVNDPYPTAFESGGFDLDGVAVLNAGVPYGVSDMNDLVLELDTYWNGSDMTGQFVSGGVVYENDYTPEYFSWYGFSYSNMCDDSTNSFTNQFSAITAGGMDAGYDGGTNYAIGFCPVDWENGTFDTENVVAKFEDNKAHRVSGFYTTNNTYAGLTMKEGGGISKKFGGVTGNDPDWYTLNVFGINENGDKTDTVVCYLADYRFEDNSLDYIVSDWIWVDLEELGAVTELHFFVVSTDAGDYGINTPAFFCIDNLTYSIEEIDNPPVVLNPLEDITITTMETYIVDLADVFVDPDADEITLSVSQLSMPDVLDLNINDNMLEIVPLVEDFNGTISIEITAEANGLTCSDSFNVEMNILAVADNSLQYNIYPNPSNGNFNLIAESNAFMYVYDLIGKLVYSCNITSGENNINVTMLEAGTYIVNIVSDKTISNYKVVIK